MRASGTGHARIGELAPLHRGRIAEILAATRFFNEEEIDVALELFDDAFPRDTHDRTTVPDAPPTGSSYAFLGAFTPEDELVGYACYGPTPETDRTYDLYWIAVDPRAQGTGGGTRLLTEVERRLQGLNARMLVVETSSRSDYAPTRGFYERRGYAEAARVREFYAPGDDRIILTKRFQSFPSSPMGRGAVQQ
ncbi:MAG TPA: GNAT family N-acetyltransferase [Gemmatimonadaceae bacterium]|nr:GNAT family N-acetyltransferase [Gemmatimonadaceae bacterium]